MNHFRLPPQVEGLIRHELHKRGLPIEHFDAYVNHATSEIHVRPTHLVVPQPLKRLVEKYKDLLADEFRGKVIEQSHPFAAEKMREIIAAVEACYQPKEFIISAKMLRLARIESYDSHETKFF